MCQTWQDHRWTGARFLASGRHPTMGRFHKYLVTCERCPVETIRTDWLDLLVERPRETPIRANEGDDA